MMWVWVLDCTGYPFGRPGGNLGELSATKRCRGATHSLIKSARIIDFDRDWDVNYVAGVA